MNEDLNIATEPSTVNTQTEAKPRKKTMSEAALAANRANAKRCTGPKTREGKFKASLNALKHGTYSDNFILKTEDAEMFENFSKSYIEEFQPQTPSELELLKQLISVAWRRNRMAELVQRRLNKAIIATIAETTEPQAPVDITLQAYDNLEIEKPSFARHEAHEFRLASLFQRTLNRLNAVRDKKLRNETKFARDPFAFAA